MIIFYVVAAKIWFLKNVRFYWATLYFINWNMATVPFGRHRNRWHFWILTFSRHCTRALTAGEVWSSLHCWLLLTVLYILQLMSGFQTFGPTGGQPPCHQYYRVAGHSPVMIRFPDFSIISSEYFTEYRPLQQQRYTMKCMLFIAAILTYSLITMTTIFYVKTLPRKELLCCIFCVKNNTGGNWPHARTHFPDHS